MTNRRGLLTGSAALGSAALMLASMNREAHAEGEPVPIGSALPISGFAAADGIEFKNGLELAAEEINAAGGILGRPIEIHVEDTKDMGADVVTQAMQRLVDRYSVPAIINGYNVGTNMVEMDVAADNDIIFNHYNTLISHNEKFKTDPERYYGCFQGDPPEFYYGAGCLLFLKNLMETGQWNAPNNKIAIVPSANEYSIVIANAEGERGAVRLHGQPVRDGAVPDQPVGPHARQAAPGPAGGDHRHALPAAGPGPVHGPVPNAADQLPGLHAVWTLSAGLPRDRQGIGQWRHLFDGDRLPARRVLGWLPEDLPREVRAERRLHHGLADL
jgi:hypothetical protein